jgi:hypothetical protein
MRPSLPIISWFRVVISLVFLEDLEHLFSACSCFNLLIKLEECWSFRLLFIGHWCMCMCMVVYVDIGGATDHF